MLRLDPGWHTHWPAGGARNPDQGAGGGDTGGAGFQHGQRVKNTPPLELYNQYSVLTVEENDELVSTVTPSIEAVSLQPVAQPPPQTAPKGPNPGRHLVHHTDPPKAYPPCPTWESCRVPQQFIIASTPPDPTNSLNLHVRLKTTDTRAKFRMHALIDSGATRLFIDREFVVKNQIDTWRLSRPVPVLNIDGTPNRAGQVVEVVDLILQYQRHAK